MPQRALLAVVLALAACGGRPPPASHTEPSPSDTTETVTAVAPPPPPEARIRLIHAAVTSNAQSVSLVADGGPSTAPTGYEFASAYLALTPGEHSLSARANDAELIGASFTFAEGSSTIVAYSTRDFPVALSHLEDASATAPENMAQVRFVHALVGQGAIDLCTPPPTGRGDGTPILASLAPGTPSDGYLTVSAGVPLTIQLRIQNAHPCHGRTLGVASAFTPASEANYTIVFVGQTGRQHHVSSELLFCADPPALDTSCATVPVENP